MGRNGMKPKFFRYVAEMPAVRAGMSPVSIVNLILCKLFLLYICKKGVIESIHKN